MNIKKPTKEQVQNLPYYSTLSWFEIIQALSKGDKEIPPGKITMSATSAMRAIEAMVPLVITTRTHEVQTSPGKSYSVVCTVCEVCETVNETTEPKLPTALHTNSCPLGMFL